MKHRLALFALPLLFGLSMGGLACVSSPVVPGTDLGFHFSSKDPTLFAAPPSVVRRPDGDFLIWTQGSNPNILFPEYRSVGGRLVFALVVQTSTGSRSRGEVRIEGAENIAALEQGGAWWAEPDGSFTRLDVTRVS